MCEEMEINDSTFEEAERISLDYKAVMQGVVFAPENPQQGSPPPNNVPVTAMEEPLESNRTKESLDNQSNRTDSGIFSTTTNTSIEACDSDNRSDCSSPERKYVCPICDKMLTSQHNFTLHIRSHNNQGEDQASEKGFACRICHKVLSSSSSLDRHVLVHSGERPFHCKFCGDTFTTNGNMHRHMRTHSTKGENYESDGSSDSGSSRSIEYNNNKIESKPCQKRRLEDADEDQKIDAKRPALGPFRCPVCQRTDFKSPGVLEAHLEDNHPEYPALGSQRVPNNKPTHPITKEKPHSKQPVLGFQDLTFVDFSSEKFPHIARRECELSLHKPATCGLKFQCQKCFKAFPCSSSLAIHETSCLESSTGLNLSGRNGICEDDIRRTEFFSRLNLQDNSPEKLMPTNKLREQLVKFMDNKDLADIPSILSNIQKPSELRLPPTKHLLDQENKNENEEESQDSFAIEFRKMKLRGEFPCRLCTAIFPNLRALKGHNRAHLSGNTNGTYYCNMCPHSSIDKAALIRHMRTHNGDRPYECSLCNYAFTTKANCERHLRNRHSKTTREDVKKSIIYHPSEDPTNDELNKLTVREEDKKHNFNSSSDFEGASISKQEKMHCSTPKMPPKLKTDVTFPTPTLVHDMHGLKPTKMFDFHRGAPFGALNGVPPFFAQPLDLSKIPSPPENASSKIQVKPFEVLRENSSSYDQYEEEYYEEDEEEAPIADVALDLSKKKLDEDQKRLDEARSPPEGSPSPAMPNMGELFAQHLIKGHPKFDHAVALYATQLANLYRNGFPGFQPFPVNPLLFQSLPVLQHTPQEIKERMQRMQLCGGGLINEDFKPPSYQPHLDTPIPGFDGLKLEAKPSTPNHFHKGEDAEKPLSINVENENVPKMHSPGLKPDIMQSPNSVKMVIKNGVLMPKQKQRRYRTERPFTCEHCSAKFTLRSNMERHIKQQHPQFWSQRQRGAVGQPGRKPQGIMLKPSYADMPSYDTAMREYDDKEQMNLKLRYALLAQASAGQFSDQDVKKEEDEDCALVIDEYENKSEEPRVQSRVERGGKTEEDLVPVSRLLDNASQQQFKEYFKRESEEHELGAVSEDDEEGLVASGSTSEGNVSGTDENRSESEAVNSTTPVKKKSAYSLAPNRVSCPYCNRKFPWTSSLRRHILTHTGQKPFKCSHCPLLFTTKSNCDRHLLRKHGNSATTIVTSEASSNSCVNYLMRNVPERPFKCSNCPSSTFSTYSNLKKHISCKHATNAQGDDIKAQGYEAGSSEDEKGNQSESKNDWEHQIAFSKFTVNAEAQSASSQVANSDLPFKCHLCESSFADRQQALDHIRDKHASEYDLLMSKNALDASATTPDDVPHHEDEDTDIRGKFPDYSNRKVICAWCMRRFWSAEDLRRHMRTHTGERPFSCDICRRRFTLKHSMLRHRKKHALNSNFEHSDEDGNNAQEDPDTAAQKAEESDAQEGEGDLISNLLGLGDRSIIDKVLDASADDAAKLLGVKNRIKE